MNFKSRYLDQKLKFDRLTEIITSIHDVKDERVWKILLYDYFFLAYNNVEKLNSSEKIFFDNVSLRNYLSGKSNKKIFVRSLIGFFNSFFVKEYVVQPDFYHYNYSLTKNKSFNLKIWSEYDFFREKKTSKRILIEKTAENISDEYLKTIVRNIPRLYVEYFDFFWQKIKVQNPRSTVFIYEASIRLRFLDLIFAKLSHEGGKIYRFQHGGFYGECLSLNYDLEKEISNIFFTWGFEYDNKELGIGSSRLYSFKKKYENSIIEKETFILLPLPYLFSNSNKSYYQKILEKILSKSNHNIKIRKRKELLKNSIFQEHPFLNEFEDKIEFDDEKVPSYFSIKKSKLVVLIDHPSTMFLECISVDHPVVAIRGEIENYEKEYQYQMNSLEKLKLIHPNVDSLLDFINNNNLDDWWSNVINTLDYQKFKDQYAKTKSLSEFYNEVLKKKIDDPSN